MHDWRITQIPYKEIYKNQLLMGCKSAFGFLSKFKILYFSFQRIYKILPFLLRRSIIQLFVIMTISGLVELLSIVALTLFFKLLYAPQFLFAFSLTHKLVDKWPKIGEVLNDSGAMMVWGCLIPVSLIVIKNILAAWATWKSALLSERVGAYVGKTIMEKYLAMPYSWHLSAQKALALVAMQQRFSIGEALLNLLIAFSSIITIFILFLGLFFYSPYITIGTVFFMGLISLGTFYLLKKRIDTAGFDMAKNQQSETIATHTALSGVREIIIYQKQKLFLKTINEFVQGNIRPRSFLSISPTVPSWTLESSGFFFIWVTIYVMINYTTLTHVMISETITLLALTAWRVLPSLNRVVSSTVSLKKLHPTVIPCLDYLESLKAEAYDLEIEPEKNFRIYKQIVFNDLTYAYPNASEPSLKNISCEIPIGATIGLVGRSGSGKTTFINVLCGLLIPTSGKMLVDGNILTPSQLAAYRFRIGYVPQNPYMLSGTIAQNVGFKDWGGVIEPDMVILACQNAAIDFLGDNCELIDRETDSGLSGGQMQRISIARALYTEPDILIFDEATSALDQSAEGKIQEVMLKSRHRRTNIIAAHRLETLEICDIIFWLENGVLIKAGPGKEILRDYRDAISKTFQK